MKVNVPVPWMVWEFFCWSISQLNRHETAWFDHRVYFLLALGVGFLSPRILAMVAAIIRISDRSACPLLQCVAARYAEPRRAAFVEVES